MDNIVIVGSSGHAKAAIDLVRQDGNINAVGVLDRFRSVGEQAVGRWDGTAGERVADMLIPFLTR